MAPLDGVNFRNLAQLSLTFEEQNPAVYVVCQHNVSNIHYLNLLICTSAYYGSIFVTKHLLKYALEMCLISFGLSGISPLSSPEINQ